MNRDQRFDIYQRIFRFIVSVIKFVDSLPNNYSNQIIRGQVSRSAPSMGANSEEADGSNTKKDFVHCFTIVRKECKETVFWLRLARELNAKEIIKVDPIIQEGREITAIVNTIILNTLKK